MPSRPAKPCTHPGCGALVRDGSSRCPAHPREAWAKRHDAADAHRLRGRKGQERRTRWLARYPLCIKCEEQNRVRAGDIVDHVIPLSKGGADDESNLQTLCHDCDRIKTAADFGRRLQPRIGPDGWPV